jgi:1,4-dihydroxy-2-naphthoate polyprenyltransferase
MASGAARIGDARAALGWRARAVAYADLGKLRIVELWVGVPLAWTLLERDLAMSWRTVGKLTLALVIEIATTAAALSFDDVAGMRDGVDVANHGDTDRYGVGKPLVSGRLTERQALRFAWSATVVAVAAAALAWRITPPYSWWIVAIIVLVMAGAINYSVGARLSYLGAGELLTFAAMAATVALPYAYATSSLTALVLVESGLLGLWMLQVAIFSNTQDRDGDREARRATIAAVTSDAGNRRFIVGVFAVDWALLLGAVAFGLLPGWGLLLLLPGVLLQLRQLHAGLVARDWLLARARGFVAFRVLVLGLLVVNLLERA